MILRARYAIGPDFAAIENAAVEFDGDTIIDVGRADKTSRGAVTDLGDCVLLPGLVNAHTHLELGHARGLVPPSADFAGWLDRLLPRIMAATENDVSQSVAAGLGETVAAGTTLLGDITRQPLLTRKAIAATSARPAVVSFGEVIAFGKIRGAAASAIAAARSTAHCGNDLLAAISPHATYTVEPDALRQCIRAAAEDGLRVCIHAAEAECEEEFTLFGAGPIHDFFARIGEADAAAAPIGMRPIEYLDAEGALGPATLLAHANYVTDADLDRIATASASVAYCPRTHAAFGHPPHRFRDMLERGINVCLGTDSLASNPTLSVLEEMRFLRGRFADLDAKTILRMATINGARALGWVERTGILAPGRRADIVALEFDKNVTADPLENVLSGAGAPVATFVAGRRCP